VSATLLAARHATQRIARHATQRTARHATQRTTSHCLTEQQKVAYSEESSYRILKHSASASETDSTLQHVCQTFSFCLTDRQHTTARLSNIQLLSHRQTARYSKSVKHSASVSQTDSTLQQVCQTRNREPLAARSTSGRGSHTF
jgi:hypothetical protein